jgi:hypothetical protein
MHLDFLHAMPKSEVQRRRIMDFSYSQRQRPIRQPRMPFDLLLFESLMWMEARSARSTTEVAPHAGAHSRKSAACPCVTPSTTTIHTTAPEMRKRAPSFAIRTP